jgi:hypothetical protein
VYQNSTGSTIGYVTINPAFVDNPASGGRTRDADAALVSLNTGFSFTSIAKPFGGPAYGGNSGQISFDDSDLITLIDDGRDCSNDCHLLDNFAGDTLTKIGVATGWTGGIYVGTEAYVCVSGLCRGDVIEIEGGDDLGDSGAPILSNQSRRLVGIAWGRGVQGGTGTTLILGSLWTNISVELTGDDYRLHYTAPRLLGFEQHALHPAACPDNPDAFDYYIIYGYPAGGGTYQTARSDYSGHSTYNCGGETVNGNFEQYPGFQACDALYGQNNCPCAALIVGGTACPTFDP